MTGRIKDQVNSNGYIHYKNISIPIYGEGRGRELTSPPPFKYSNVFFRNTIFNSLVDVSVGIYQDAFAIYHCVPYIFHIVYICIYRK